MLPSRAVELATVNLLACSMAVEISAALESPAGPSSWCPHNIATTMEKELWMISVTKVVGVHKGWAWPEMEDVVADLVVFNIGNQGVSLSVEEGRRW